MARAFTLVELTVVVLIVVIISTLAVPASVILYQTYQREETISTFESMVLTARAAARAHRCPVALRIERAFETDDEGRLVTGLTGEPIWLDYQHIRLLILGHRQNNRPIKGEEVAFRQLENASMAALPETFRLAPDYVSTRERPLTQIYQPLNPEITAFSPLETFYLVWNYRGELIRMPAQSIVYLDETQNDRLVDHPDASALGVICYQPSSGSATIDDISRGIMLFVNRHIGMLIEADR